MLLKAEKHPQRGKFPFAGFREIEAAAMAVSDVEHRKPSVENARRLLDWVPTIDMKIPLKKH